MCPQARTSMIVFTCGPKNKLTNVYEFSPCVYKFSVDVACQEVESQSSTSTMQTTTTGQSTADVMELFRPGESSRPWIPGPSHTFLDLLSIVENLYSYNFEPENLKYDAGQYQYYIDDDFQPKQSPG